MGSPAIPIFLVDDDESIRRSLRRLLVSEGYAVETFPSASAFLDSISMDTEGILILDIRMPGMDGFGLQQRLIEFHSPLKIIFITAHTQPGEREHAMASGAQGFLQKPFNTQSLLDVIDEIKSSGHHQNGHQN